MCAKNHLLIFSSFLDIWENVEWPRFFGPPCTLVRYVAHFTRTQDQRINYAHHRRHHRRRHRRRCHHLA